MIGRLAGDRIAAWMHETALRLYPDSPYAKEARARPSLADRICDAIKELTAERQTRTYAARI